MKFGKKLLSFTQLEFNEAVIFHSRCENVIQDCSVRLKGRISDCQMLDVILRVSEIRGGISDKSYRAFPNILNAFTLFLRLNAVPHLIQCD